MIPLGCKNAALKHVLSFRRQVYMFLSSPTRTLEVSFRVNHGENSYRDYASTESLKCFEGGNLGHKSFACPNGHPHLQLIMLDFREMMNQSRGVWNKVKESQKR